MQCGSPMHELVAELLRSSSRDAVVRLESHFLRGAALLDGGVEAARDLARGYFDLVSAGDPMRIARCLGRLTLGDVEWLELHGADGVGTRARIVLDEQRSEIVRLAATHQSALWLATVAGYYEGVRPNADSPAGIIAEAHRVRAQRAEDQFLARVEATFVGEGSRELRLAAAIAWCLAHPGFGSYLMIDGKKDLFFGSVPESVMLEDFPFRLGDLGEVAQAVHELTYCTSWARQESGDDPHFRWEPPSPEAPAPPEPIAAQLSPDETNPYMLEKPSGHDVTYELAGLDAVDWKALDDAYGHGGAVPTFLRSLASRDENEREWALQALFAGINHQGSTYSASVAALPFLTALACEPLVPDRAEILRLLVGLATGEPAWALLDQKFETLCLGPLGTEAARFFGLFEDEDHWVRSQVIHLLGHLESARGVILPALSAALEREADPYLRASLVMAMARVSRGGVSSHERAVVSRARDLVASESMLGRAVATLCLFYLDGALTEADRTVLHDLDRSRLRVFPSYAWNGGKVGEHAREIHKATMPVEEALAALERGEWDCQERARELLFTAQDERPIRLLLPEQMSENQMRYLRSALSREQAYYDAFWRDTGLPHTETWLKRFVGALPEGPLDRRVRVRDGEWPIWNVLYAVLNDLLPLDVWVRVADAMSDEQLLLVYDDATSRDLQLDKIREHTDSLDPEAVARGKGYRDRLHRILLDRVVRRAGLVEKFETRADELLSRPLENASYLERTLLFAGLGLAAEAANRELDARFLSLAQPGDWSPAMTHVEPLRWGLGRLPLELRWKWFEGMRLISLTRLEDARGVRHKVRVHDGWQFLDLIPTREAADALKQAISTIDQHREGKVTESMELGLTRGPLITWATDDELPLAALARIRESWGKLWQELYPP